MLRRAQGGRGLVEGFDLETLLAPLPDVFAGEDLRQGGQGGVFFRLKDLRADARSAEREAISAPEQDAPVIEAGQRAWSELADLAADVLRAHSKDMEVAAWLCEAWVRLEGFVGLTAGLELVERLVESFWDAGLHPQEDEDGVATRVAPIGGLLGLEGAAALLQPIRLLPLSDQAPEVALWTVETAFAPLQGGDDAAARERLQAKRAEQVEAVRQGLLKASPAFLRQVHRNALGAVDQIERLAAVLDAKAGVGRFGSQVTQPLRAIAELLEAQVGDRLVEPVELAADGLADATTADAAPAAGGFSTGRAASRADAYDAILRIADFFAETEPQSLVARSLREVVRRGRLPLEALLSELLPDASERTLFLQRAGVKDESSQNETDGYN